MQRTDTQADAIRERSPWIKWAQPAVVFVGWLMVFGFATDRLGDPLGLGLMMLLGPGVAIILAVAAVVVPRVVLRRELRRCQRTPACVWCGHSLKGVASSDSSIRCPECGKPSPGGEASGPDKGKVSPAKS